MMNEFIFFDATWRLDFCFLNKFPWFPGCTFPKAENIIILFLICGVIFLCVWVWGNLDKWKIFRFPSSSPAQQSFFNVEQNTSTNTNTTNTTSTSTNSGSANTNKGNNEYPPDQFMIILGIIIVIAVGRGLYEFVKSVRHYGWSTFTEDHRPKRPKFPDEFDPDNMPEFTPEQIAEIEEVLANRPGLEGLLERLRHPKSTSESDDLPDLKN